MSVTIGELKDPVLEKKNLKNLDDTNKKPNIQLFLIESWFSLKMDVKRAVQQNLPLLFLPQFKKKKNYFSSGRQLSGGERIPLNMNRYQS